MYKNHLIVLIKKDGQPLRETDGKYVYLPFNSEYSIEIKNQWWKRAIASIKIDGTDVLGGQEIIIPAYGTVNVERFITDGNLEKGRKLKFVPLSDSRVQDPSSAENGLVEIECWFEKPPITGNVSWTTTTATWPPVKNDHPFFYDSNSSSASNLRSSNTRVYCCSAIQDFNSGDVGATVEGSKSNQSFTEGKFGEKEPFSTTFKIWLRGVEQEVTTEDKLYCTNCGKKMRFDYKFCPRCGSPSQIA